MKTIIKKTLFQFPTRILSPFVIILTLCYVNIVSTTAQDYTEIFKHTKTKSSESVQRISATQVINRLLPIEQGKLFEIHINHTLPQNTFLILKSSTSQTVKITGSSGIAACKGFYYYLKFYLNCHISWEGSQLSNLPSKIDQFPNVKIKITSPSLFIYYQNVCTWSYSFIWWKWSHWQKHLDWMAFNGISLTLSPAQESVWENVYTELGLTQNEIDEHFAGPAFMSWQRMGNMRGFAGPLSKKFLLNSMNLQKKINQHLRELGCVIALPAFAGHVPVAIRRIFPNATLTPATKWCEFPNDYCCPLFVDPMDQLFQKIGQLFLSKIIMEYGGENHIYFSDPFNEIYPTIATTEYIGNSSLAIFNAMKMIDSKAIWLLQGWMFQNGKSFWTNQLIKSFLTSIPLGRMLVLDLMSELDPIYARTESYYGQPFIWCMLHNFGGTLGMHGSVNIINTRIVEARNMTNNTMIGFGITPEGINQNYVMYEFALERGWHQNSVIPEKWFQHYISVRYGQSNKFAEMAWEKLRTTVYAYSGDIALHGQYTVCVRPSLHLKPDFWYNTTTLDSAWNDLLLASDELKNSTLFKHDLVDLTRQFLQNKIDILYNELILAYQTKQINEFNNLATCTLDTINDMDRILSTNKQFLLGQWLESAKSLAKTTGEEQQFEYNARNQITIWGPSGEIRDYAIKQWSGLVRDYCLPRWNLFFLQLNDSLTSDKEFNYQKFQRHVFKDIEEPFTVDRKSYSINPIAIDTIQLAKEIYLKWINPKYQYRCSNQLITNHFDVI